MLESAPTDVHEPGGQTVRRRWALPSGLGEAVGLFLILRLSLGLLALTLTAMERLPGPCFQHGFDAWPDKPALVERGLAFQTLGVWQRWDSCWYLRIATHGYGRYEGGEPATAFFPAYPALTRLAGTVLGGRMLLGGLVVSGLAFIAAITGLYRLVLRDFDRETARRACLYISIFPTAFFFFAPFTEALFLAASVWAIYAARMRWWSCAFVAGLIGGLTRNQGAVLMLPLAWEAFQALREAWRSPDSRHRRWLPALESLPAVLAPPLGVGLFFLYSRNVAGLSHLEAQERTFLSWHPPWTVVQRTWDWVFNQPDVPWRDLQVINGVNLFALMFFVGLFLIGARRLPFSYSLFAAPQLIVLACTLRPTPLTSTTRYLLVLFPVFVILAILGRWRWLDQGWLILSTVLLGFFTAAFLRNTFIA